jgi:hypothetical protein
MDTSELISEVARMWVYHGKTCEKFNQSRGDISDHIHRNEMRELYGDDL